MSNENDMITPSLTSDDIYTAPAKEFAETPAGMYRMALAKNIRVSRSNAGNLRLDYFLTHTGAAERGQFKGVNGSVLLEGTNVKGQPNAKQFGDLLAALGVAKTDIIDGKASVKPLESLEAAGADAWKGVPAAIVINGDITDLTGREVTAKVTAFVSKTTGKTKMRVDATYPVRS